MGVNRSVACCEMRDLDAQMLSSFGLLHAQLLRAGVLCGY